MIRFLIIVAILGPSLTFVAGAAFTASRYQRRLRKAHEYAEGALKGVAQAEMHGFRRGRVAGVTTGLDLRDQIDEIGDYST